MTIPANAWPKPGRRCASGPSREEALTGFLFESEVAVAQREALERRYVDIYRRLLAGLRRRKGRRKHELSKRLGGTTIDSGRTSQHHGMSVCGP